MKFQMVENYGIHCNVYDLDDTRLDFKGKRLKKERINSINHEIFISFPLKRETYNVKCFVHKGFLGAGYLTFQFLVDVVEELPNGEALKTFVEEFKNYEFVESHQPEDGIFEFNIKDANKNLIETKVKICEDCSIDTKLRKTEHGVTLDGKSFIQYNNHDGYYHCFFTIPKWSGEGKYDLVYYVDKKTSYLKKEAFVQTVIIKGLNTDAVDFVQVYDDFQNYQFQIVKEEDFLKPLPKKDLALKIRAHEDVKSVFAMQRQKSKCFIEIFRNENGEFLIPINYNQCKPRFSLRIKKNNQYSKIIDFKFK